MTTVRLGAALFNADHTRLGDEVMRLAAAGLDLLHLDVFDGHFVSDMAFPPRTLAALRPLTTLPFEVHLGALNPLRLLEPLAAAGTDLLLIHAESVPMVYEALFMIREHALRPGLALTLGTPLTAVEPVIRLVDSVLLLSRVTGEGAKGAVFDPLVLPRVRALRALADQAGVALDIQVAGSVKREHIPPLVQAGATTIALGAGLYRTPDMAAEVQAIRQMVAGLEHERSDES